MMAPSGARLCLVALSLVTGLCPLPILAGQPSSGAETLDIQPDPGGGLHATATLHLPAPPSVVQQVLTDYERWERLFGVSMRMLRLERREDRVITEVSLSHPILPGENRLLCESRELPGGGLVTTLIEGDFKRYERTWRLAEDEDRAVTKAQFELVVEVETWAPNWLIALELKRQLTRHFAILQDTVAARTAAH
jgi:hypothetical protein